MKKINSMLRRCKTLSRSNSTTDHHRCQDFWVEQDQCETTKIIFVGSSRRRYLISSEYLRHPLLNALIEKTGGPDGDPDLSVKCEVVLFDHLLWMLQNADPNLISQELYVY